MEGFNGALESRVGASYQSPCPCRLVPAHQGMKSRSVAWYSELARRILPRPTPTPAGDKPPRYIFSFRHRPSVYNSARFDLPPQPALEPTAGEHQSYCSSPSLTARDRFIRRMSHRMPAMPNTSMIPMTTYRRPMSSHAVVITKGGSWSSTPSRKKGMNT